MVVMPGHLNECLHAKGARGDLGLACCLLSDVNWVPRRADGRDAMGQ